MCFEKEGREGQEKLCFLGILSYVATKSILQFFFSLRTFFVLLSGTKKEPRYSKKASIDMVIESKAVYIETIHPNLLKG